VIDSTPLLDCFRRGEMPREARLLAAQGALTPRAYEQLAILVLLVDDRDRHVRLAAERTIGRIPEEALKAFLARPDVPIGMREFFGDRGVFPAEIPQIEIPSDEPLIDTDAPEAEPAEEDDSRDSAVLKIAKMGFTERLKAAMKGSREVRAILIRDPNRLISTSVLSSPKVNEQEIESFARMASVSEDVLRIIGANRMWMRNYGIVLGLTRNPKTPLAMSMNMMNRLTERDLTMLSTDRNVPDPLRIAARRKVVANVSRR
jgi:hypothetical protein